MKTLGYTYWKDDAHYVGYLDDYPDYWTQAETEDELKKNLIELFQDLSSGVIPHVRRHAELEVA